MSTLIFSIAKRLLFIYHKNMVEPLAAESREFITGGKPYEGVQARFIAHAISGIGKNAYQENPITVTAKQAESAVEKQPPDMPWKDLDNASVTERSEFWQNWKQQEGNAAKDQMTEWKKNFVTNLDGKKERADFIRQLMGVSPDNQPAIETIPDHFYNKYIGSPAELAQAIVDKFGDNFQANSADIQWLSQQLYGVKVCGIVFNEITDALAKAKTEQGRKALIKNLVGENGVPARANSLSTDEKNLLTEWRRLLGTGDKAVASETPEAESAPPPAEPVVQPTVKPPAQQPPAQQPPAQQPPAEQPPAQQQQQQQPAEPAVSPPDKIAENNAPENTTYGKFLLSIGFQEDQLPTKIQELSTLLKDSYFNELTTREPHPIDRGLLTEILDNVVKNNQNEIIMDVLQAKEIKPVRIKLLSQEGYQCHQIMQILKNCGWNPEDYKSPALPALLLKYFGNNVVAKLNNMSQSDKGISQIEGYSQLLILLHDFYNQPVTPVEPPAQAPNIPAGARVRAGFTDISEALRTGAQNTGGRLKEAGLQFKATVQGRIESAKQARNKRESPQAVAESSGQPAVTTGEAEAGNQPPQAEPVIEPLATSEAPANADQATPKETGAFDDLLKELESRTAKNMQAMVALEPNGIIISSFYKPLVEDIKNGDTSETQATLTAIQSLPEYSGDGLSSALEEITNTIMHRRNNDNILVDNIRKYQQLGNNIAGQLAKKQDGRPNYSIVLKTLDILIGNKLKEALAAKPPETSSSPINS